ncbi:MAG: arginine--tRNA ligase [Armatimonadetes bacterium]|nr:arginine--tRNA ligase [Armatimonadota bacterium]
MAKDLLLRALTEAVANAQKAGDLPADVAPRIELQSPRDPRHGDIATSLALVLASETGQPARALAEILVKHLQPSDDLIAKVEIAGPGFVNFTLSPAYMRGIVKQVLEQGDEFGSCSVGGGRSILLEFVSANPTGPVGVVQGRAAAIGDTLAHLLTRAGWKVSREYYINDALNSTQIQRFAETLEARYLQQLGQAATVPDDGYQGEYVVDMADELLQSEGDRYVSMTQEERLAAFYEHSLKSIVAGQQRDMEAFGVRFDNWFYESSLYEDHEVESAVKALQESGHTYEAEDALWFRATEFGDTQDQVLVRRDGRPGYLAADIAYHRNKFERGFDRLIDIWGPDHHGHVTRTKAGVEALGYEAERFEILIHQIVRLFRGTEMVRMSKRAGDIIPLSGLLEDVGPDAARFFFLMQSMESHLDFDLELAKKQANENPVFYVQYAHARIASILREAKERGISAPGNDTVNLDLIEHADEFALIRKLGELPDEIAEAAARYEPHRMTRYAREVASAFHVFYTNCRVLNDDDSDLTAARLAVVQATQTVLATVLGIMGVSAPEKM